VRASAECRDLLGRILVADPAARLSLAGIQAHAWFCAALPEGCQDMNARLLEEPPEAELQARRRGCAGVAWLAVRRVSA
jgi:serine/threonine-protein kinase SRK2